MAVLMTDDHRNSGILIYLPYGHLTKEHKFDQNANLFSHGHCHSTLAPFTPPGGDAQGVGDSDVPR